MLLKLKSSCEIVGHELDGIEDKIELLYENVIHLGCEFGE